MRSRLVLRRRLHVSRAHDEPGVQSELHRGGVPDLLRPAHGPAREYQRSRQVPLDPWAIACAREWLAHARNAGADPERVTKVRRVLGYLVVDLKSAAIDEAKRAWPWIAADNICTGSLKSRRLAARFHEPSKVASTRMPWSRPAVRKRRATCGRARDRLAGTVSSRPPDYRPRFRRSALTLSRYPIATIAKSGWAMNVKSAMA